MKILWFSQKNWEWKFKVQKIVPRFQMQKRTGTPSGQIEVPIEITKLQKEILNLQLERQNIPSELQYECSTPEHRNNGKTLANLGDELFKFHHENHNLRVQVMTRVQQLKKTNEEI